MYRSGVRIVADDLRQTVVTVAFVESVAQLRVRSNPTT